MSRENMVKRIVSVSTSTFIFVLSLRLLFGFIVWTGLYQGFFHSTALGLTFSIPAGIATWIYLLTSEVIEKEFRRRSGEEVDEFAEHYKDAQ